MLLSVRNIVPVVLCPVEVGDKDAQIGVFRPCKGKIRSRRRALNDVEHFVFLSSGEGKGFVGHSERDCLGYSWVNIIKSGIKKNKNGKKSGSIGHVDKFEPSDGLPFMQAMEDKAMLILKLTISVYAERILQIFRISGFARLRACGENGKRKRRKLHGRAKRVGKHVTSPRVVRRLESVRSTLVKVS